MLPANLLSRHASFLLFKDRNNLRLRESRLFHQFKIKVYSLISNCLSFRDTYKMNIGKLIPLEIFGGGLTALN
ncbi:hypothetical protein QE390_005089 [Siphonobacter sp. SORGH_AS 1065]|nr:hypothetical protein [Siphonobacter sp. SORGH_AS_1065]